MNRIVHVTCTYTNRVQIAPAKADETAQPVDEQILTALNPRSDPLFPGIYFTGWPTLLLAAFLMGIVNAFLRPLVILFTLPATVLTFGLFLLVINAGMFGLTAWFLDGFAVSGFWSALGGWLIVSFVAMLASCFIGPKGRYEIIVVERH